MCFLPDPGAVVYAFHILLTADFTKKEDGLLLGICSSDLPDFTA